MQDFYNINIIPTILKTFKINNIIVSGIDDAKLIKVILNHGAEVTQINTDDDKCIKGNPLEILPNLEDFDAIFINDDPNWFTVFHELNIIKKMNEVFPLVFICNNNFPNKRRDSYLNPDDIPIKFRQEYTAELSICYNNEKISIYDGFFHASEENTPQNGVLTAIEDFLNENSHIAIMNINFIKEISILYPKSQINQKRISIIHRNIHNDKLKEISLSDKLIENQLLISYINKFNSQNKNLIDLNDELARKNVIIGEYENTIKTKNNEITFKESQFNGIKSKLSLKDSQIKNFESKLVNRDLKIQNLESQLSSVNEELNSLNKKIDDEKTNNNINDLESQLVTANNSLNSLNQEVINKDFKINELTDNFKQKESEYNDQIKSLNRELNSKEENLINIENKYVDLIKIKNNEINFFQNDFKQKESEYNDQIKSLNRELNSKEENLINNENMYMEQIKIKDSQIQNQKNELNDKLDSLQNFYTKQQSIIDKNEYCINCYKKEISNNHLEIKYLKTQILTKKILSPLAYLYLILKSNPKEIRLNINLYKSLKNSKCFDIGFYLNNNPDLIESKWCKFFSPELHYVCKGFDEGRLFNKKYFNRNSKKELLKYILTCGDA